MLRVSAFNYPFINFSLFQRTGQGFWQKVKVLLLIKQNGTKTTHLFKTSHLSNIFKNSLLERILM